jgi:hypothetical protein
VETEPHRDAAPVPTVPSAPALNLMFDISGLSKMSQNLTDSYRAGAAGAGAASNYFLAAGAASK